MGSSSISKHHSRGVVVFCPMRQSALAPIVVCWSSEQSARCDMIARIKLDDRLSILRQGDRLRNWDSLDDRRVCVLCGRKFKGRQVDIRRLPGGKFKLCCPTLGCTSAPQQWGYPASRVGCDSVQTAWPRRVQNKSQRHGPESTLHMHVCHI